MNIETGKIRMLGVDEAPDADEVQVKMTDATKKQREEMQVSKQDNKSILGRTFTSARKARKAARKSS